MELTLIDEIRVFLLSLCGGIFSGFLYDLFRIVRRVKKTGRTMTFSQDVIFWILNIILIFWVLFYANYGQLRWYEFFAIALGLGLYLLTLSKLVIGISVFIINLLTKVLVFIIKIIVYPFYLIYRITYRPIRWIKSKISKKIVKIELTYKHFCFKIKKSLKNINNMKGK